MRFPGLSNFLLSGKDLLAAVLAVGVSAAPAPGGTSADQATDAATGGSYGEPLVVLLERNHWAMVIGAESPSFALYQNGVVLYRQETADPPWGFLTGTLPDADFAALIGEIESLAEGAEDGADYCDPLIADLPSQDFLIQLAGKKRSFRTCIYAAPSGADWQPTGGSIGFAPLFKLLTDFDLPGARPWLPEKIEIMAWPYEYAPDPSINWPDNWPDLSDPATVERRSDNFSLYIDSEKLEALVAFLRTQSERGAILMNARKWSMDISFPFPNEIVWMRFFE